MSAIVSFEATGPYEENLADECLAAGVPAVRLDAWKTRQYAESEGMLEKQIEKMDALCTEAIKSDEKMNALAVRFEQVVGVATVLISTMLSSCPDIGSFTSKGIAKMAGVAPIENKSCTIRKKSKPRRGRRELRSALYMAAVSACHSNHLLEPVYKAASAVSRTRREGVFLTETHFSFTVPA